VRVVLDLPPRFSFARTVLGHGWYDLPPFTTCDEHRRLATVVELPSGGAAPIRFEQSGSGLLLTSPGRPAAADRRHLIAVARRIFNLELDLEPFYRATLEVEGLSWIPATGSGRLLRGPSLFEDLAKLVLTTNCTWALTRRMVGGLVDGFGAPAPDGRRAFPGPEAVAGLSVRELRDQVKVGYRAPMMRELAGRIADGECDLERLATMDDPEQARNQLMQLPGVGPYVAENWMRMLGRPCGLALDSFLRSKYARVYHQGRTVKDRTIARRYARFGSWAGMALWCDMTRDWLDEIGEAAALLE
jgi:N-glycosylase/DNA lyase